MPYRMIVLAKQVPDTQNITGEAMKDDGTVNRDALPKIFNPEDLNALEMALAVRDEHGGSVAVLTMGPPSAAELLRDALMRGADEAVLLTDTRFAVADTLATAYTLSKAIDKLGRADIVFCGRQAIDGDTAQIGPQVAGNLGVPQITYAERIVELAQGRIKVQRNIEGGYEVVETPLPALLTVTAAANEPRPRRAKRMLKFRKARTRGEVERLFARPAGRRRGLPHGDSPQELVEQLRSRGLLIAEWNVEAIGADAAQCGFAGSPTRVMNIDRVVLQSGESEVIQPSRKAIGTLMRKLIEGHILD